MLLPASPPPFPGLLQLATITLKAPIRAKRSDRAGILKGRASTAPSLDIGTGSG